MYVYNCFLLILAQSAVLDSKPMTVQQALPPPQKAALAFTTQFICKKRTMYYTKNVKLKSIGSRVNCGHNKLANYADVFFIKKQVSTRRDIHSQDFTKLSNPALKLRISSIAVDCLFFLIEQSNLCQTSKV